jgi:excisionase family DNA binding protein
MAADLTALEALLGDLVERIAVRVADEVERRIEARRRAKPLVRLMPPEEVAAVYGLTVDALYKQAKRGSIPSVKLGGLLRFRSDQIEAHIISLDRTDKRVVELAKAARKGVDGGRKTG